MAGVIQAAHYRIESEKDEIEPQPREDLCNRSQPHSRMDRRDSV